MPSQVFYDFDAFAESVRYLQLRQLHPIHRVLKAADPEEVSVRQNLLDHGELAVGRFASCFCQLFGVLPSKTHWKRSS